MDKLRIIKHENGIALFELEGEITNKTLPTLIVNIAPESKFILDIGKLDRIDMESAFKLAELSKIKEITFWNAKDRIRDALVKGTFLFKP